MAFNPGVQDQRGMMWMQGLSKMGDTIGQGIQQYAANKRQDSALTGLIEGYDPAKLTTLGTKMKPEGQKALEKFLTGKATLNDKTLLAGALQAASKIEADEQEKQMRALQMQEAQRMAAERQRAMAEQEAQRERLRALSQFMGGVGGGVLRPEVQAQMQRQAQNPAMVAAAQVQQASANGQAPDSGSLLSFMAHREANDTRRAVQEAKNESAAELTGLRGELAATKEAEKKGQQSLENTSKLRNDFYGLAPVKEFQIVDNYYTRGRALAKDDTGASDIALMFSYMKVLDPTSVVREGEYATVQNSGSIPENVRNLYNKAMSGEKLQGEQRTKFVDAMKTAASVQYDKLKPILQQYEKLTTKMEADPDDVIPPAYRDWNPDRETETEKKRAAATKPLQIRSIRRVQ